MATPLTAQIGRPERVDLGAALIGGMQIKDCDNPLLNCDFKK